MSEVPAYPKIHALGHRLTTGLNSGPIFIEEKLDGSQFSFMRDAGGELLCRSKSTQINVGSPEKMFASAVETAKRVVGALREGEIIRAEAFCKPKHNALAYSRVPEGNLAVFDIEKPFIGPIPPVQKEFRCRELGLEKVPWLQTVESLPTIEVLQALLEQESFLGGVKVEGVVLKAYGTLNELGEVAMAKYVSEKFKEANKEHWGKGEDFLSSLAGSLRTEARWRKVVQHLAEEGKLKGAPADIPLILRAAWEDILQEEGEALRQRVFDHLERHLRKAALHGLPEWYKAYLFEKGATPATEAGCPPG